MDQGTRTMLYIGGAALVLLIGGHAIAKWGGRRLHNVVLLGDSLTAGGEYRWYLAQALGMGSTVEAHGYSSKGTAYILDKLDRAMDSYPTDIVILAGVNDLASDRSPATVINNLEQMYTIARERGVRVIAVKLTPWAGHWKGRHKQAETQEVNDWIEFMAPVDRVVDTSMLGDEDGKLLPQYWNKKKDKLHLGVAGQHMLGQLVYEQGF
jgi:lysophospholipase L1-like esterase